MGGNAEQTYKQSGLFMMIGGIIGMVSGSFMAIVACGYTLGLCCWWPLIVWAISGAEIYYGMKVQRGEVVPNIKNMSLYLMIGSFVTGHFIGGIMELLAYLNYSKPEVEAHLQTAKPEYVPWTGDPKKLE